jgi:hypothetical protein
MLTISAAGETESNVRGFQQLVVDAVELAGSISPSLKAQLVFVLGRTFPAEVPPTFMYAKHEADRLSDLHDARKPLDICVAFLIDHANCGLSGLKSKLH